MRARAHLPVHTQLLSSEMQATKKRNFGKDILCVHAVKGTNLLPCLLYICNGVEWSKDKTQAAESIKWRPQQAYGSNQFLLVQPQTVFSTHTKSSRSRIDKRTARATGNTRYRYSKIAPLDHKMADNCVSLARTNTLSSTITKPIKT